MSRSLIEMKQLFFDRPGMTKNMDRAKLRFLSKAGAYVRRSARSSIRQSKKTSEPGRPPKGKTKRLKDSIFFGLDKKSVVIGPIKLESKNRNVRTFGPPVSEILERGGEVEVHEIQGRDGTWSQIRERSVPLSLSPDRATRWRKVKVAARPFMVPALRANQSKFPGLLKGQFKKGR
jgi:hypothetical protein